MQIFIASDIEIKNGILNEVESKHCVKVLRKKNDDEINITNGKGLLIKAIITNAHPKNCSFKITQQEVINNTTAPITIAIAPTKNMDRFEFFVEKCTEIGIEKIIPIKTFHSERKVLKKERINKISIAACKQSKNFHFPIIEDLTDVNDVLKLDYPNKFVAYCGNQTKVEFAKLKLHQPCLILIGPEGDFSEQEVQNAIGNNFKTITLGESRLRTETAGIVACTIANLNYE